MYRKNINALVNAWNTGNFEELDQYMTEETLRHAPTSIYPTVTGLEGVKAHISDFRTAYPDLLITVDEELYLDGRSVIRWTFTGTNTGPGEYGPTSKYVHVSGASIAHYEDDKIKEEYVYFDTADFYTQLGLIEMSKAATG